MSYSIEADITVLGGLPVTVEATFQRAEPDVGIMGDYIDDWEIIAIGNRACKKRPEWLYKRIDACKGEDDRICDQIYNQEG